MLQKLKLRGDLLSRPRRVEHFFYAPDNGAKQDFENWAQAHEFATRGLPEHVLYPGRIGIALSREHAVDSATIDLITLELLEEAGRRGIVYDSWDAELVGGPPMAGVWNRFKRIIGSRSK
jgi:hypothetical protein